MLSWPRRKQDHLDELLQKMRQCPNPQETARLANEVTRRAVDYDELKKDNNLIPETVISLLSTSMEERNRTVRGELINTTIKFLQHNHVGTYLDMGKVNLSEPLEMWLTALTPQDTDWRQEELLSTFAEEANNLSSSVGRLCLEKIALLGTEAHAMLEYIEDEPADEDQRDRHRLLTEMQFDLHNLRDKLHKPMRVVN